VIIETPALWLPSYTQGFARSAAEAANPGLWTGLVGLWVPSLGPTGLTLFDQSGYRDDGTLTNMEPATDWAISSMGSVLELDGANEYVSVPSALSQWSGQVHTVSAWVRCDAYDANGFVFFGTNTGDNVYWQVQNDTSVWIAAQPLVVPETHFADGKWHLLSWVSKGASGIEFFRDGTLLASSGDVSTSVPSGSKNFAIGDWIGNLAATWTLNGAVGPLAVHNRILTTDEIQPLYRDPHAIVRPMQYIPLVPSGAPAGIDGDIIQIVPQWVA